MAVLSVDLGGTKLATALIDNTGELLHVSHCLLEKREGNDVGDLILQKITELITYANDRSMLLSGLGICVPGIYYAQTGRVWAPNIPGWEDYPLMNQVTNHFESEKLHIRADSDRACYILGERWKGNARGCSDAIFLSVGTGIGAGIVTDNRILRGGWDISGAIGWMALDRPFDKKYMECGCFEYNASGSGIARKANELLESGLFETSSLRGMAAASITARELFEAYDRSDPLAITVINNAIECWGMAVANLVSLFNPQKIIFGGGVFGPALRFLDAIREEAVKWAQPISMKKVKLEGSALGSDAGLYGAGFLALRG